MPNNQQLIDFATAYLTQGFSVVAVNDNKIPTESWRDFTKRQPTPEELYYKINDRRCGGIAIVGGMVSGGLTIIDVDIKYHLNADIWVSFLADLKKIVPAPLIVETKNKGFHIYLRCPDHCPGNIKLASRYASPEELKQSQSKERVLFETRGEGGYVVAPPTAGYTIIEGSEVPHVSKAQLLDIFAIATSFNEVVKNKVDYKFTEVNTEFYGLTPWEDYDSRGDVVGLLQKHGWQVVNHIGNRVHLLRPGATDSKTSGNFHTDLRTFYVFSTSTEFESEKGYTPTTVYTILEHSGNKSAACRALASQGYGAKRSNVPAEVKEKVREAHNLGKAPDQIAKDLQEHGTVPSKKQAEKLAGEALKEIEAEIKTFWDFTERGKLYIVEPFLKKWLHDQGFALYRPPGEGAGVNGYIIIFITNNIVREVGPEFIKKHIVKFVESLPENFDGITKRTLLELIYANRGIFDGRSFFDFFDFVDPKFLRDGKDRAFMFFLNGVCHITAKGFKMVPYNEVDGLVWETSIIQKSVDINIANLSEFDTSGQFNDFLRKICEFNNDFTYQKYYYLLTMMGYLMHRYKNPGTPFAFVIMEQCEDPNDGGGTGKGLLIEALKKCVNVVSEPGETFTPSKNFAFQKVNLDTSLICMQDCTEKTKMRPYYSIITDGLSVEKKNQPTIFLPYEISPKFVFTTNFDIESSGNHGERRTKRFEMGNFFNRTNKPDVYYGNLFFNDWDHYEWQQFYWMMAYCVAFYLENGVMEISRSKTAVTKSLRNSLGDDFVDYVDAKLPELKTLGNITLKELLNDFYNENEKYYITRVVLERKLKSSKEFKDAFSIDFVKNKAKRNAIELIF